MKCHKAITKVPSQDMCLSRLGFSLLASYIEAHFLNYWCGIWSMSNSAVLFLNGIWRQGTRMEMDESWRTKSGKTTALLPTRANSLCLLFSEWFTSEKKGRMKYYRIKISCRHAQTRVHKHIQYMCTHACRHTYTYIQKISIGTGRDLVSTSGGVLAKLAFQFQRESCRCSQSCTEPAQFLCYSQLQT